MDILFKMFQERQLMLRTTSTTTTPSPLPVGFDPDEVCGNSWKNDTFVTSMRFWVAGVSLATVDFLGLLGNLISLITLATMTKRGLFIKLLVALTFFDILFLVNGGLFMLQQAFSFNNVVYNALFPKLIYPLAGFSMTASTYTCLAIAIERYIGICRAQSDSSFYVKKVRYYIIAILIVSTVVDVPRFFELTHAIDRNGDMNGFEYTQLRRNNVYVTVYTLWFRLVVTAAVPFTLMVFFNLRILIYYKKNSSMMTHILVSPHSANNGLNHSGATLNSAASNHHSGIQQSEKALYVTFFCLTTTFLFCHLPRIILNIYEVPMSRDRQMCEEELKRHYYQPSWVIILSYFEKLALIFNCSINFVFYCFASKMFKTQMIKVIFSRLVRMCQIASEVIILADRPSEGHQALDAINSNNFAEAEMNTVTATGTMETGLPSSEAPIENGMTQKRQAFLAKLKSFEDNDNLATIREAVAIIEPPIDQNTMERQPESPINKVASNPDLMLTVSMPYGSYLGHGLPVSKSHPNLKVTVSLTSLNQGQNGLKAITSKTTSTSDLEHDAIKDFEECDSEESDDEDVSSIYSSCSAGSNSSCSSSFDENCPHCVISIRTKGTDTRSDKPEVFL